MTCKTNSSNLSISQPSDFQRQRPSQCLSCPSPAIPGPGVSRWGASPAPVLSAAPCSPGLQGHVAGLFFWEVDDFRHQCPDHMQESGFNAEQYCQSITRQRFHPQFSSETPAVTANWGLSCSSLLGVPGLQRKEQPATAPYLWALHTHQKGVLALGSKLCFRFHRGVILKDFQDSRVGGSLVGFFWTLDWNVYTRFLNFPTIIKLSQQSAEQTQDSLSSGKRSLDCWTFGSQFRIFRCSEHHDFSGGHCTWQKAIKETCIPQPVFDPNVFQQFTMNHWFSKSCLSYSSALGNGSELCVGLTQGASYAVHKFWWGTSKRYRRLICLCL